MSLFAILTDILKQIHAYHLTAKTYDEHLISDILRKSLTNKVDTLMENLIAGIGDESKLNVAGGFEARRMTKCEFIAFLEDTIEMYRQLREKLDTEIQAIIDEFIAETNQTLYRLNFD